MKTMSEARHRFRAGEVIALGGHNAGEPARLGEILEVVGEEHHERYRVVWEDGHESILYPGHGARLHVRRTPVARNV